MKPKLKPIDQQVVVVFGASSGIGREAALQFARRGAKVMLSARGEAGLNSLLHEIREQGGEADAIPADVIDFDQVKEVADRAAERWGGLDTWAHLAAVSLFATFDQTTPEEFKHVVHVNLIGQAYGAMAALPHLKRRGGGALIHVSSVEAERALPLQSAYAASKHGIKGFVDAMRMELQHDGWPISVTNIMPATVNTPLFNNARTKLGVQPKGYPPFYSPRLVAQAIIYAAEHPVREMTIGDIGKFLVAADRLTPRLAEAVVGRTGHRLQRTDQNKTADAPDNLYGPIDQHATVEGDFGDRVQPSPATWLQLHPRARWAIAGTTMLGAAALLLRRGRYA